MLNYIGDYLYMGVKDKWKTAGKSIGGAFSNFGKAVADTAKVAFTDEEKDLGESWKKTGKGFAQAGEDFSDATVESADKVVDSFKEDDKKEDSSKKKEE